MNVQKHRYMGFACIQLELCFQHFNSDSKTLASAKSSQMQQAKNEYVVHVISPLHCLSKLLR